MAGANKKPTLKRKASPAFIPGSIFSYVMGALRDNFDQLKNHILHDCAFVALKENSSQYMNQLLEELFRYLYLLADSSSDGVIRSSPSYFVDQAYHCLMLDPVLYWKVCDEILDMQGKSSDEIKMRLLPHDPMGGKGDDERPRKTRYTNTLAQYKVTFGEDPPLAISSDYSNDPVAVKAEVEAQRARSSSEHRPHPVSAEAQEMASLAAEELITIKMRSQSGEEMFFKARKGTLMIKFMQAFSDRKGVSFDDLRFTMDGIKLERDDTPLSLEMEDGDQIDVVVEQKGC